MNKLELLHPKIKQEVIDGIKYINDNLLLGSNKVMVTQTLRTIQEQDALYKKGRSVKGQIVTNAKGGQSIHNYGLAFDICLLSNGKAIWDVNIDSDKDKVSDWIEVVNYFKSKGFVWGGDWKFKDMPHFEKTFGNTWRTLIKKPKLKVTVGKVEYIYPEI